jgi:hypothetical protein
MIAKTLARRPRYSLTLIAISLVTSASLPAYGISEPEATLGISYAHLELDGADGTFETHDGVRIEPRFSVSLIDDIPQLRLGAGLGISGYSERTDDDITFTDDDGDTFEIDADDVESLSFLIPEIQLSWRQPVIETGEGALFIEPGVAVGVLIANYSVDTEYWFGSDEDIDEWDTSGAVRPFIRAGYAWSHFVVGLEASYLIGGKLDLFGDVEGDPRELIVGGFVSFRF